MSSSPGFCCTKATSHWSGIEFEHRFCQDMCRILEIDNTRTMPLRRQWHGWRVLQHPWGHPLQICQQKNRRTGICTCLTLCWLPFLCAFTRFDRQVEATGNNSETGCAATVHEQLKGVGQFARHYFKVWSDHQRKNYDHPVNQFLHEGGKAVWLYGLQKTTGLCPK